jgi:hypothetical protein
MINWDAPGTFSTQTAKEEAEKGIEFLRKRANEIRTCNYQMPFADLHEHYAGAISAYLSLLEEGIKARELSIQAFENILKGK